MKSRVVLFIHGAGEGACAEDRLLADSLQTALGAAYEVQCPQMPREDSPEYEAWKAFIERRLADLNREVILVGHSFGASVLLKLLCDSQPAHPIAGLFLIATPFWRKGGDWDYDAVTLPPDAAMRLGKIAPMFFYHSHDDEIVPFAHLASYAAKLPHATIRELDGRGHQLGNDLIEIADDIKAHT
jgi:uncharacterized protein